MSLGHKIALSKQNWERKTADYYPTPPEATMVLLDYLKPYGPLRVREPCCGEGHMSVVMETYGHAVTSSDLRMTGYGKGGVDYIALPPDPGRHFLYDAVITNPPFKDAEAITRRALADAPVVAMFLPSGYWHAKSRMKLFKLYPPIAILALTWRPVFLPKERGLSPLANFAWTVWDSRIIGPTEYRVVPKPSFRNIPMPDPSLGVWMQRVENSLTGLLDAVDPYEDL